LKFRKFGRMFWYWSLSLFSGMWHTLSVCSSFYFYFFLKRDWSSWIFTFTICFLLCPLLNSRAPQHSTNWATLPALCFCFVFEMKSCHLCLDWPLTGDSPVSASWVAGITGVYCHTRSICSVFLLQVSPGTSTIHAFFLLSSMFSFSHESFFIAFFVSFWILKFSSYSTSISFSICMCCFIHSYVLP
jgi:hypothetical protein